MPGDTPAPDQFFVRVYSSVVFLKISKIKILAEIRNPYPPSPPTAGSTLPVYIHGSGETDHGIVGRSSSRSIVREDRIRQTGDSSGWPHSRFHRSCWTRKKEQAFFGPTSGTESGLDRILKSCFCRSLYVGVHSYVCKI